jgi:hypothetical protein
MSVFRASNTPGTDWSVPVQRGPYPAGYLDQDGPTERLYLLEDEAEPPAEPDEPAFEEPARHRGAAYAVAIALIALFASGGASLIAWHALARADQAAGSMASMHVPSPPGASVVAPSEAASASAPAPTVAGSALLYAQEPLQIQVDCGAAAFIDLDGQPRVDAPEQQSDLRYDNRCGSDGPTLSIGPGAQAGAHVADPDTDRPGCADAIGTDALEDGEAVPVQKGTVLCVSAAASLDLVEVTGLGRNGAASLRATGWMPMAVSPSPSVDTDEDVVPSDEATPGD